MPVTNAGIGHGSTFALGDGADLGSNTYTPVGEVVSITSPKLTREAIEATHLMSPDKAREYIAGLIDGEACTIRFNYVPAATSALLTAFTDGKRDCQITWPNGITMTFSAVITGWDAGEINNEKMTGEFTVKPSGLPQLA